MNAIDQECSPAVQKPMNLPELDWELCRSFLAVLRAGSLAGAARRLGVTHPTIRRHVEELEAGLGSALFVRSPSGLAPTELAESLRDPAQTMEAAFEQLVRTASGAGDAIEGTVRITASEVMTFEVLPLMLAALKERYPGLVFELVVTDEVVDVLRHEADLAVRLVRPAQVDLVAKRVGRVPFGLFATRQWIGTHPADMTMDGLLRGGYLIGYDRSRTFLDALAASGVRAERRDFGFRSDNTLAQLAALRAGLGVGVCQLPLAARDPTLDRVLPEIRGELEVWVVSHRDLLRSRRVRACMDALAQDLAIYCSSPQGLQTCGRWRNPQPSDGSPR